MSKRKTIFTARNLMQFFVLLVIALATATTVAECEGTWDSSSALICQSGTVCAEWDVGGSSHGSCCIPPQELGSGNLEACAGPLVPTS